MPDSELELVDLRPLLRVDPDEGLQLSATDTRATPGLPKLGNHQSGKGWAKQQLQLAGPALEDEQEKLWACGVHGGPDAVLLVLQAMDCGGKGGATKHVVGQMNPLGVRVTGFGPPTAEERRHHFLWRVRREVPGPGYVGVFDRSHYEDVLIQRVHRMVEPRTWRSRYGQIRRFETELAEQRVHLVKVMLHISPAEQADRLGKRLHDPSKYWKYDPADLDERRLWDRYQAAYHDALLETATERAPWYVIPADRKWYRNWALSQLLLSTFAELGLSYPEATFDVAAERERWAAETAS